MMKKIYIEKGDFPWSNLKGLYKDAIYFPIKMSMENQPVVGLKVLGRIIYITSDRDLIQAILNSHSDKIIKGSFAKKLSLVIGNGMITAEGNEWKEQRQLIQPLFNNNYLKTYFSIISDQAQLFINKCNKINGTEIMMFEEMNKLSFNIICETTLGNLLIDKHPNVIKDIINMGRFLNIMNILGISNPWIKLNPTFQIYNKKIKKIRASLS
ncbi:MAG: cytochrome P450, partial [Sediminibacterium sp.]|nr:cytochrome P450 [Sediminibacterium sp.]